MEICDNKVNDKEAVPGHLYRNRDDSIYLCTRIGAELQLHSLMDGNVWNSSGCFGFVGAKGWEDVTGQYCLTKKE